MSISALQQKHLDSRDAAGKFTATQNAEGLSVEDFSGSTGERELHLAGLPGTIHRVAGANADYNLGGSHEVYTSKGNRQIAFLQETDGAYTVSRFDSLDDDNYFMIEAPAGGLAPTIQEALNESAWSDAFNNHFYEGADWEFRGGEASTNQEGELISSFRARHFLNDDEATISHNHTTQVTSISAENVAHSAEGYAALIIADLGATPDVFSHVHQRATEDPDYSA